MFGQGSKPAMVFGQAATPTTTTAESGFGRIDALFSSSGQSQAPASNLFTTQTSAFPRSTPLFGSSAPTTIPAGNLFGTAVTGAPSTGTGSFGVSSQPQSVFGGSAGEFKPVFGAFGGAGGASTKTASTNLTTGAKPVFGFGEPGASSKFDTGSKQASGPFSRPASALKALPSSKPDTNLFGKGPSATGTIFGKPAATSAGDVTADKPTTTNLFKAAVDDTKSSKALFGKKDDGNKPAVNPFGATSKTVFGGATGSSGLFGKPAEPKSDAGTKEAVLFGKPQKQEKDSTELFGKKSEMTSNPFAAKPTQPPKPSLGGFLKKSQDPVKPTSLFGKPAASQEVSSGKSLSTCAI